MLSVPMHTDMQAHRKVIADNLREARRQSGLTQVQVAQAIGAAQDQVSKWERGVVTPSMEWRIALAEFFYGGDMNAMYGKAA
jgi:DNA-binding XRE family transcriptional regulator